MSGFNPLRWDCEKSGCFNKSRRPKIEVFSDCFPRKINFGDVDGIVELNGWFLMLEWKGDGGSVGIGQRIMYEKLTKLVQPGWETSKNVVFVVHGDAETMDIKGWQHFVRGKEGQYVPGSIEELKEKFKRWVIWTRAAQTPQEQNCAKWLEDYDNARAL